MIKIDTQIIDDRSFFYIWQKVGLKLKNTFGFTASQMRESHFTYEEWVYAPPKKPKKTDLASTETDLEFPTLASTLYYKKYT